MRPKLCLSDGLNTTRHGTVKFGDQIASATVLTAGDLPSRFVLLLPRFGLGLVG
jgi:hypothetical protein